MSLFSFIYYYCQDGDQLHYGIRYNILFRLVNTVVLLIRRTSNYLKLHRQTDSPTPVF